MTICQAFTRNGKGPQCSREAEKGKKFCWQHEGGKASPSKKSPSRSTSPHRVPQTVSEKKLKAVKPKKVLTQKEQDALRDALENKRRGKEGNAISNMRKQRAREDLQGIERFQARALYFFEAQSEALCGQHSLNNFFGNCAATRDDGRYPDFISTESDDVRVESGGNDADTFNLKAFCKLRILELEEEVGFPLEADAEENIECQQGGNYDIQLLHSAVERCSNDADLHVSDIIYSDSTVEYREPLAAGGHVLLTGPELLMFLLQRNTNTGLIVNLSGVHYVAVVNIGPADEGWVIIDSLKNRPTTSYSASGVFTVITAMGYKAAFSITPTALA
jgi:hypothetical protein